MARDEERRNEDGHEHHDEHGKEENREPKDGGDEVPMNPSSGHEGDDQEHAGNGPDITGAHPQPASPLERKAGGLRVLALRLGGAPAEVVIDEIKAAAWAICCEVIQMRKYREVDPKRIWNALWRRFDTQLRNVRGGLVNCLSAPGNQLREANAYMARGFMSEADRDLEQMERKSRGIVDHSVASEAADRKAEREDSELVMSRDAAIKDWLTQLNVEEHVVIKLRYWEKFGILRISSVLGVSVRQVTAVHTSALAKLRRAAEDGEFDPS